MGVVKVVTLTDL
jgi:23S rRNA (guanine745-N1)-methyltransferase